MKHVRPFLGLPLIVCGKMNACDREDLFWSSHAFSHPPHNTFPHSRTSFHTYSHLLPHFSSPPPDLPTLPTHLPSLPHSSPHLPRTLPHYPHSIYPFSLSRFTALHTSPHPCTSPPTYFRIPSTPLYTSHTSFHISPYLPPPPTLSPHFPHLSPHLSSPPPHLNTLRHSSPHLPHTTLHNSTHTFSHLPPHPNTHPHIFPSPPTPQHISPHLSPPFAYLPICSNLPIFSNVHLSQCSLVPKRLFAPKCPFLQMSICPCPHMPSMPICPIYPLAPKCSFAPNAHLSQSPLALYAKLSHIPLCPQCPFARINHLSWCLFFLVPICPKVPIMPQIPICPNAH